MAFIVGAVAGLFCVFMLSMALGLATEFTPTTRIIVYAMCPILMVTYFPGAWVLTILLNACLYAGLTFSIAKFVLNGGQRQSQRHTNSALPFLDASGLG